MIYSNKLMPWAQEQTLKLEAKGTSCTTVLSWIVYDIN